MTSDADGNGQPDNAQPLYRARNGDITKNEDPKRLYLERSTRAAEAQLGKSDYAPNAPGATISVTDAKDYRQAWSLVASTALTYLPVGNYKKITTINGQLYVIATTGSGFLTQCYAYKPESLATIKQSTQNTRQLQYDFVQSLSLQFTGGCNG